MRIFLSYASEDRVAADAIRHALHVDGHDVFFDREDLPPGEEFHSRIRRGIETSDFVIFLITPKTLDRGSYTLNEIAIAEKTWKAPAGRVLPVILERVDLDQISAFLRAVTFLETPGNVTASVADAVARVARERRRKKLTKLVPVAAIGVAVAVAAFWYLANREAPPVREGRDGAPAAIVSAGSFVMGDDELSPRREVYVDTFYMDRFETTTARYAAFLASTGTERTPDYWENVIDQQQDDLPVIGVSWHDANAYCRWAGKRLPTESEWEKAARGTDQRIYPWGDDWPTLDHANYGNASPLGTYEGALTPVGAHRRGQSPYGIEDLAGNASEWVADWYAEGFASGDVYNPRGPDEGTGRVVRGGGRYDPVNRLASAARYYAEPETRADDIGFRCASDP